MKTVLITGGGRGLGRVTAGKLAGLGHRVVLAARTPKAASMAASAVEEDHPGADVQPCAVDLSSLDAVRRFGTERLDDGTPVDVLFHVAGVMQTSRITVDGLEETLAVNVLAPFLLTGLLLPVLESAGAARVVAVSSELHQPGSRGAPVDFDFDDPQLEHRYDPDRAYKNSKLAVLWFTYQLAERLAPRPITANAVCPGFVPATAAASTQGLMRPIMRYVMPHMPFATSVDRATDSLVFMAADPSLDRVSGQYFSDAHPIESSPESHDPDRAQRFWELAANLTGNHTI